jgi:hypothetical protein
MAGLFMRDVSLTLKLTAGTAIEFNCNVHAATVEATPGDTVDYQTLCVGGDLSSVGDPTYVLHLIGVQDWKPTAPEGLAHFLAINAPATVTFVFQAHGATVPISTTAPGYTGTCTLVPPNYGGEADTWAEFDVSLPITGKPALITVPPTLLQLERMEAGESAADVFAESETAAAEEEEPAEAAA